MKIGVRIGSFLMLVFYFLYEVILSSMKVLVWIYTKPRRLQSEFYELPLKTKNPWAQVVIAHFITSTPGTLAVDINHEKASILIHFLESKEQKETRDLIQKKIEPLVMNIFAEWRDEKV